MHSSPLISWLTRETFLLATPVEKASLCSLFVSHVAHCTISVKVSSSLPATKCRWINTSGFCGGVAQFNLWGRALIRNTCHSMIWQITSGLLVVCSNLGTFQVVITPKLLILVTKTLASQSWQVRAGWKSGKSLMKWHYMHSTSKIEANLVCSHSWVST